MIECQVLADNTHAATYGYINHSAYYRPSTVIGQLGS